MSDLFYLNQLNNEELRWELWAMNEEGTRATMIDVGILQDTELGISIGHEYGSGMKDPAGSLLSDVHGRAKSISPYYNSSDALVKNLGNFAKNFIPKTEEEEKAGKPGMVEGIVNDVTSTIDKLKNKADEYTGALTGDILGGKKRSFGDLLNSSFLSAFDLIKTFTGTNTEFSLPKLETTWIHGLKPKGLDKDTIKGRFENIIEYVLGDTDSFLDIYGLQYAPNKYSPKFTGLGTDNELKGFGGTFTLFIGNQYEINNLVLRNFNFVPSVLKVKGAEGNAPLYATVTYEFEHAAYISKKRLKHFLNYPGRPKEDSKEEITDNDPEDDTNSKTEEPKEMTPEEQKAWLEKYQKSLNFELPSFDPTLPFTVPKIPNINI